MAVHHHRLHHLHYHHLHLLSLVQSFILTLDLALWQILSTTDQYRPSLHYRTDHQFSDHLTFLICSRAEFVYMVCHTKPTLSHFSNALEI